jgi:hypothetical protein
MLLELSCVASVPAVPAKLQEDAEKAGMPAGQRDNTSIDLVL